jgi:hypothetical protein
MHQPYLEKAWTITTAVYVLCCAVLCCAVLCCAVLCCAAKLLSDHVRRTRGLGAAHSEEHVLSDRMMRLRARSDREVQGCKSMNVYV